MSVKVQFDSEVVGNDNVLKTYTEADGFGLSNTGDLILVKYVNAPLPPGAPAGARNGENIVAIAAGVWQIATREENKIERIK